MDPLASSVSLMSEPHGNHLTVSADVPPNWQNSMFHSIPFIGPFISILGNASKYGTKLEDCADFIAADLEKPKSEFVGHRVGATDTGKPKVA